MFYRKNVSALSRMKTSELIALRAEYVRNSALYRMIKLGFLGIIGILAANLAKIVLDAEKYDATDEYSFLVLIVSIFIFVYFNYKEVATSVKAGMISDILSIRLARTSTKKS